MKVIRYIHWKPEEAEIRADRLRGSGYIVDASPFDPSLARKMKTYLPEAFVIDLDRLPSHGREIGVMLRMAKPTRLIPLIYVGGEVDKVARVREILPDAVYCTWDTMMVTLEKALAFPLREVFIPESIFASYAGTPLFKKLGVRQGMHLGLLNAPQHFESILGEMPEGAVVRRDDLAGCSIVVWFVTQQAVLVQELPEVFSKVDEGSSVWIAWPKISSKVASDMSQTFVRKSGLTLGWVDYKICSIDATWTGLCFKKRKSKD